MLLELATYSTATKYRPKTIPEVGEVWGHRRNLVDTFKIAAIDTGKRLELAKKTSLRTDFLVGFVLGKDIAYVPFSTKTWNDIYQKL
jgi:hypothetical protein